MDPTKWQELWPNHAAEIYERLQDLLAALNSLSGTALDPMVEAAATQWAIERLEEWMTADMTAELELGGDPNLGDED
jgi:hypothetical protein